MADGKQPDKNRPEQLNENNDKFWKARGHEERPEDWETRTPEHVEPSKPAG